MEQQQSQTTHFYILTLTVAGLGTGTITSTVSLPPGMGRSAAYRWIREDIANRYPELAEGTVTFFSLEPEQL